MISVTALPRFNVAMPFRRYCLLASTSHSTPGDRRSKPRSRLCRAIERPLHRRRIGRDSLLRIAMSRLLLALGLVLTVAAPRFAFAQRNCKKGIPCGNSCISSSRICRIGSRPAPPSEPEPSAPPKSPSAKLLTAADSSRSVKVWINKKSRVYHCPGSRYYGATSSGEFTTEREAIAAGYRGAYRHTCRD